METYRSGHNGTDSKSDWDSFETSWDFQRHPLVTPAIDQHYMLLSDCWRNWERACADRFAPLKANEEELNRIFIDIYGLQDELTPDVDDKDVTVRKADLGRDIRSLISYAVGCMVGRYSLDKPGLAFAGGAWDASQYVTYPADKDGILPITDDEYFADDIVTMFVNWLKTVYGADTLEENLRFISDALGGKVSPPRGHPQLLPERLLQRLSEGLPEAPYLLAVRQRQEERLQSAGLHAPLPAGHHCPRPHGLCARDAKPLPHRHRRRGAAPE